MWLTAASSTARTLPSLAAPDAATGERLVEANDRGAAAPGHFPRGLLEHRHFDRVRCVAHVDAVERTDPSVPIDHQRRRSRHLDLVPPRRSAATATFGLPQPVDRVVGDAVGEGLVQPDPDLPRAVVGPGGTGVVTTASRQPQKDADRLVAVPKVRPAAVEPGLGVTPDEGRVDCLQQQRAVVPADLDLVPADVPLVARGPYTSSSRAISVASDFRGPSFRIRV